MFMRHHANPHTSRGTIGVDHTEEIIVHRDLKTNSSICNTHTHNIRPWALPKSQLRQNPKRYYSEALKMMSQSTKHDTKNKNKT